jgi:hypothetical protein
MEDDKTEDTKKLILPGELTEEEVNAICELSAKYQIELVKDIERVLNAENKNIGAIIPYFLAGLVATWSHKTGNEPVFLDIFNSRYSNIMAGFRGEEEGCEIVEVGNSKDDK